jgi:TRAP-type mannitol/chloroaromatic compound transport system substrate-binding protein
MNKMGVVAQNMPAGEVYQALEKGTLDATEFVGPYDDEKLGFAKVAPFYYYPGWWEYSPSIDLMVNARAYEQLPAAYKAILEAACAESWHWMAARYDVLNPAAMRRLVAAGTQLRAFPRDVMQASFRASQELYAELGAQNPRFKRLYEQWDRFRTEQVQWARVAEDTLANFMAIATAQR